MSTYSTRELEAVVGIRSPNWVVFAGKKDVLGSFDQDVFAGGDGTDQFVNQSFSRKPGVPAGAAL